MNAENALEIYTKAVEDLKNHERQHSDIFNNHKQLLMKIIDAENILRDEVSISKTSVSNESHIVSYTPQAQTFVDQEALVQYIKEHNIDSTILDVCIKTVERPARITISDKKL